jgi:hypothetical protein
MAKAFCALAPYCLKGWEMSALNDFSDPDRFLPFDPGLHPAKNISP